MQFDVKYYHGIGKQPVSRKGPNGPEFPLKWGHQFKDSTDGSEEQFVWLIKYVARS